MCSNWSWGGRIVLVGDGVHKFTPSDGLGINNGVQDIVAVCNRLRKLVAHGGKPSSEDLQKLFDDYCEERRGLLESDLKASAQLTRLHARASVWHWLLARYVMAFSVVQRIFFSFTMSPSIQIAKMLDFIPTKEVFKGEWKWLYPMPSKE